MELPTFVDAWLAIELPLSSLAVLALALPNAFEMSEFPRFIAGVLVACTANVPAFITTSGSDFNSNTIDLDLTEPVAPSLDSPVLRLRLSLGLGSEGTRDDTVVPSGVGFGPVLFCDQCEHVYLCNKESAVRTFAYGE